MIDGNDIEEIDKTYFDIVEIKDYGIALRSRCTGHFWYLLEQEYNQHRTFQIHHKHNATSPYHIQRNRPSITACCDYIRSHDAYHLQKRKGKKRTDKKDFCEKKGLP